MNFSVTLKNLVETEIEPVKTITFDDGILFVDFGKSAFGTIKFFPPEGESQVVVHLGEKLDETGRIDRDPPGTIRYRRIVQSVIPGEHLRLVIPHDKRNTGDNAIAMPIELGEVMPFRYVEIESGEGFDRSLIHQVMVHYPFDNDASDFQSNSPILNSVWDLSKYTIKATTFCGVYVDGDRERIPYEGDAYINQLGHYGTDQEYDFARYSHEYMIHRPTWCTEWHLHSVMMAWMDVLYSGNMNSLKKFYNELRSKTLIDFAREDGLISVDQELRTSDMKARLNPLFKSGVIREDIRDVMDWPPGSFTEGGTGERDNHEMAAYSTVTNAFHAHALALMSKMAKLMNKPDEATYFKERSERVAKRINEILFDPKQNIYVDGEGSVHSSLHSNMFMLAFELVPEDRKKSVIQFIKSRGMACSVYGAQHLLDGLYLNGEADYALELLTATHDRSWWNMIQEGSTMTLESWGYRYKNNLDWNHAWGAAPANLIPRYLAGVRPLEPGFQKVLIQPQPGSLEFFHSKVPTPLGPVTIHYDAPKQTLNVETPQGMTGVIQPPQGKTQIHLNGSSQIKDQHKRVQFH